MKSDAYPVHLHENHGGCIIFKLKELLTHPCPSKPPLLGSCWPSTQTPSTHNLG